MSRCLIIARFQPLHNGHLYTIEHCLSVHDEVVVVIGMASQSHTPENPFTAGERIEMVRRTLKWRGYDLSRLITVTLPTLEVNRTAVHYVKLYSPVFDVVITLNPIIRRLFIEEGYKVEEPPAFNREVLRGSVIRRLMASGNSEWKKYVPLPVAEFIEEIGGVERVRALYTERLPGYFVTV